MVRIHTCGEVTYMWRGYIHVVRLHTCGEVTYMWRGYIHVVLYYRNARLLGAYYIRTYTYVRYVCTYLYIGTYKHISIYVSEQLRTSTHTQLTLTNIGVQLREWMMARLVESAANMWRAPTVPCSISSMYTPSYSGVKRGTLQYT